MVRNGTFEFRGKLDHPERAAIVFEREFSEFDGSQSNYYVFLNRDSIKLVASLVTDTDNPYFKNDSIIHGDLNIYYRKNIDKLWNASSGVTFRPFDTTYMDSLRKFVLPGKRSQILEVYNTYFSPTKYSLIGLSTMRSMLENEYIFPFKDLTKTEKDLFTRNYEQIDTSLSKTADYKAVSLLIEKLNSESEQIVFNDFVLTNIDGSSTRLSDIIKKNTITVLDFWWFGCAPCRKFNQETHAEYDLLKAYGVEVVGINTDMSMQRWKEASGEDSINWVNLYAGPKSPIEIAYNVSYAPFKVVIDRNFNLLDAEVKNTSDLIDLVKSL